MIHEDLVSEEATVSSASSIRQQRGHSLVNKARWRCRLCGQNPQPCQTLTDQNENSVETAETGCTAETAAEGNAVTKVGHESKGSNLMLVNVPAAFRYLTYELACLNVQTRVAVKEFT